MKYLSSKEVRRKWLDFWVSKSHNEVASKSLIPVNDPTLLWINSGVATLKDYFSGKKKPVNPRITNSQKSIRTNDIENVGVTARHHTLFEMLGNFSIGDYFKQEVLEWASELLFEVYGFEKERIYITYYGEDQETYKKWIELGVDPSHLIKGDKETNFWDVGSGPCGPDTEIFYDRGPKYDPENIGLRLLEEDLENDRYIEIWNIVFSEFNNDGEGNYNELAQKNIDTGAGLERIVSIFQDAPTNFETDLFVPIIKEIEKKTDKAYDANNYFAKDIEVEKINKHFRVIADHIRASAVAINDGAKPSNSGRGYIIRRLIRRAYRSGRQLGIKDKNFLFTLIDIVSEILDIYKINVEEVKTIIKKEEEAFSKTISQGEELLEKELSKNEKFDFSIAFKLFETYGFPVELTQEILASKNIELDISRFEEFKKKHADASRSKTNGGMDEQIQIIQEIDSHVSEFTGYDELERKSNVIFSKEEKGKWYTLLDKTPMYATKGGQHQDAGTINSILIAEVYNDKHGNHWHISDTKFEGEVLVSVNKELRLQKSRNHSATHILFSALRDVIGQQATQLGSDNNEKRLRFDFPVEKKLTKEEIQEVEDIANKYVNDAIDREYLITSFEKGVEMNVVSIPGEDYGEGPLRVVKFGNILEFCGGTHVNNTKDIEVIKITKVDSRGSGVSRIEAITSFKAVKAFEYNKIKSLIETLAIQINKNKKLDKNYSIEYDKTVDGIEEAINTVRNDNKLMTKKAKNVSLPTDVEFVKYKTMKAYINLTMEPAQIKGYAINLREAHPDALIIVGATKGEKTTLAVASNSFDSKAIFDEIANEHKGRGGGNQKFAMGSMEKVQI